MRFEERGRKGRVRRGEEGTTRRREERRRGGRVGIRGKDKTGPNSSRKTQKSSGSGSRSRDLWVMSPARCPLRQTAR